jgi:hypothetical protein
MSLKSRIDRLEPLGGSRGAAFDRPLDVPPELVPLFEKMREVGVGNMPADELRQIARLRMPND